MTRQKMMTVTLVFLAVLVVTAGARQWEGVIADRDLGLSKTSVFEDPAPPVVNNNASFPGDEPALDPAFPGAPALIPHGVQDFMPITRTDNQCLDCHWVEEKEEGEPTPVPESHFRDLRADPDQVRDTVAGARFVCTSCHVSLTDAQAPVGNSFPEGLD